MSDKILSTEELIRDFNKYYKQYKTWKQRAQKAESKLKKIEAYCTKPTGENFTVEEFLETDDVYLTEIGIAKRDILRIIESEDE